MEHPSDKAFRASPLFQELEKISTEDDFARFDRAAAKRQHFIPMFLLSRFAHAGKTGRERLCQLDVRTGQPRWVAPRLAASRRHFYAIEDETGERTNRIEGFLALVESHAAPALGRFLHSPEQLSEADRATLSYFFALMNARTPGAIQRTQSMSNVIMKMLLGTHMADSDVFARDYRKVIGDDASDEDIESLRLQMLSDLQEDRVDFADPKAAALHLDLSVSADLTLLIFGLQWNLLRCPNGFVTSDRGLAIHDPHPRFPWSGQAWASSPYAETSIPLSPEAALIVSFAGERLEIQDVGPEIADTINLRTYGWASDYVFGHSQELTTRIRALAKRRPGDVVRPKANYPVMLLEAEPGANSLAREHRRRGWPPYLLSDGVLHDYVVLGIDGEAVEVAAGLAATVKERAQRVLAAGEPLAGRARIESADLD